jgi:hypothetical protein
MFRKKNRLALATTTDCPLLFLLYIRLQSYRLVVVKVITMWNNNISLPTLSEAHKKQDELLLNRTMPPVPTMPSLGQDDSPSPFLPDSAGIA